MIIEYFTNFSNILSNVWIYVLIGFIITFLIQILVPKKKIADNLGKNSLSSIIKSSIAGIVLSACSYGAVPIIAALRKKGASTTNCLTMLLSSPWMGLSQLAIISGYTGIINAVILLLASILIAILGGLVFSYFEKNKVFEQRQRITRAILESCNCDDEDTYLIKYDGTKETMNLFIAMLKNLFIGLLLAALVQTILTPNNISDLLGTSPFSLLYAVPISTLLEVVGEGLGIIAGELYSLGANLGVVFTIMMMGVSTDITELTMLNTIFGKKTTKYYIIISLVFTIIASTWMIILI